MPRGVGGVARPAPRAIGKLSLAQRDELLANCAALPVALRCPPIRSVSAFVLSRLATADGSLDPRVEAWLADEGNRLTLEALLKAYRLHMKEKWTASAAVGATIFGVRLALLGSKVYVDGTDYQIANGQSLHWSCAMCPGNKMLVAERFIATSKTSDAVRFSFGSGPPNCGDNVTLTVWNYEASVRTSAFRNLQLRVSDAAARRSSRGGELATLGRYRLAARVGRVRVASLSLPTWASTEHWERRGTFLECG